MLFFVFFVFVTGNSELYEWVPKKQLRYPLGEDELERYPRLATEECDATIEWRRICRAKTHRAESFPAGIYLAGEVIKGKCVYGWNEIEEEAEDFDVLRAKCTTGQLTWLKEDEELEFGAERIVRVQNNTAVNDFIGICEYEHQNGWSRGNTCQWKRPQPGAHRERCTIC